MPLIETADLLAQVPAGGMYISIAKLIVMLVLFGLWVLFAQWADKDALVVNTWRVPWNLATMSAGIVGTALMLLLPMFLLGVAAFVVLTVGAGAAYVVHRNGLVTEETKVFTPAHIKRLSSQGFKKKQKLADVKERVRLTNAANKSVEIPEDPVVREHYRLLQDLLFDVLWRRANLVEVVPAGQVSKIRYLIDGIPAEREPMPRQDADAILGYFKTLAGLNLDEKRKPQTGKIGAAIGENHVDVVVRTGGSTAGEKLGLQMIGAEAKYKVDDLGFNEDQLKTIKDLIFTADKGLILISGPRGSGLTTSFYAFARSHDAFLNNIQTLEVNREYDLENITRHDYKPSDTRTFAAELQKITRTDPDIIFLPEVREAEAAVIACQGATHKQKVYVGVPGEDVYDAIKNWMALANDKNLLSKALVAVTNQRLVRKLCSECKQPYKPDPQTLRKANLPQDKLFYRPPDQQFDKHGNPIVCQNCHGTGYVGRTGIFDVIVVDEGFRDVLRRGGSVADIRNYMVKKGAQGLQAQALTKVLSGETSIQEVIRVTRKPATPAPPGAAGAPAQPAPKSRPSAGSGAPASAR